MSTGVSVCSDGVRTADEGCDDGNTASLDGTMPVRVFYLGVCVCARVLFVGHRVGHRVLRVGHRVGHRVLRVCFSGVCARVGFICRTVCRLCVSVQDCVSVVCVGARLCVGCVCRCKTVCRLCVGARLSLARGSPTRVTHASWGRKSWHQRESIDRSRKPHEEAPRVLGVTHASWFHHTHA